MYQFGPFGNCLWHPHIYWSDYIYQKAGKKIQDCKNVDELRVQADNAEDIFYLSHIESDNDLVFSLSKINKEKLNEQKFSFNDIKSDSVVIFGNSSKDMFLTYNYQVGETLNTDSVLFSKDSSLQKIIITDKNVSLNSFSFSSY